MAEALDSVCAPAGESDLHIRSGVTAASGALVGAGDVTIDGSVSAGADIRAAGNVRVGGDVESARVACGGASLVLRGAIRGGSVSAYQGVTCRAAGNRNSLPTDISVGIDDQALDLAEQRFEEIRSSLGKVKEFQARLQPMLHTQKTLTAAQKEQVSELLYTAGEARKRADAAIESLKLRLTALESSGKAECVVTETLFEGVTIYFPGAKVKLDAQVKGPLKISLSRNRTGLNVELTDLNSGHARGVDFFAHRGRLEALRAALEKLGEN